MPKKKKDVVDDPVMGRKLMTVDVRVSDLQNSLKLMNAIKIRNCLMSVNKKGTKFEAVTEDFVALLNIETSWIKYFLGNFQLIIVPDDLSRALKSYKKNQDIKISFWTKKIVFKDDNLTRSVVCSDAADKPAKLPEVEFTFSAKVTLKEVIPFLKMVDKSIDGASPVRFVGRKDRLEIQFSGATDDIDVSPDVDDIKTENETTRAWYPTTYLFRILKLYEGSDVSIEFGDDIPIKITKEIDSNTNATIYLAPRIQSD